MFLEMATTTCALTGAYLAGVVGTRWLYLIFGLVLAFSAVAMFRKRLHDLAAVVPSDRLADRLRLHDTYFDQAVGEEVSYQVTGTKAGLGLMYIAGTVSRLLGIGSGALKVPAMDLAMRLPIKVSTATSNFMIGVTAAAGAGVFFARGQIDRSWLHPSRPGCWLAPPADRGCWVVSTARSSARCSSSCCSGCRPRCCSKGSSDCPASRHHAPTGRRHPAGRRRPRPARRAAHQPTSSHRGPAADRRW